MLAKDREANYGRVHHFVTCDVWNATPLMVVFLADAHRQVSGENAESVLGRGDVNNA